MSGRELESADARPLETPEQNALKHALESSSLVRRVLGAADRVRTCDQRVATVDLPL